MLPTLIPLAVDAILTLVETLLDNLDQIIDARYWINNGFNRRIVKRYAYNNR